MLISVLWISYSIRLNYWYFPKDDTIRLILIAPIIGIPIFSKLGLYKLVIRHIDLKSLWLIVQAVSLYAILWGIIGFFIQSDFVIEKGFVALDFVVSKALTDSLLIKFIGRNILNPEIKQTQKVKSLITSIETNETVLSYKKGSQLTVSIKYTF